MAFTDTRALSLVHNALAPYYVFRPGHLITRVVSGLTPQPQERRFPLEWGSEAIANPRDVIGANMLRRGIYDLVVSETLLRLIDPGERAVDAGANIGMITSLLAHAVGAEGSVVAFEPHPLNFERLGANVALWRAQPSWGAIETRRAGLSNRAGTAVLTTGVFGSNPGTPTLETWHDRRGALDEHEIETVRLDDALADGPPVAAMKMDIEGHEASALAGAERMLADGRPRDIVFEDHETPPTPVTTLLHDAGYALMRLGESLRGPLVAPLDAMAMSSGDDQSLLATSDPERALSRLGPRGWAVYGLGPAGRVERARRPR